MLESREMPEAVEPFCEVLVVDLPASVNNFKSYMRSYWMDSCLKKIGDRQLDHLDLDVSIVILYPKYYNDSKKADIDNVVKPIFDMLVKSGLIEDDSWIQKLSVEMKHDSKYRSPKAKITIRNKE